MEIFKSVNYGTSYSVIAKKVCDCKVNDSEHKEGCVEVGSTQEADNKLPQTPKASLGNNTHHTIVMTQM